MHEFGIGSRSLVETAAVIGQALGGSISWKLRSSRRMDSSLVPFAQRLPGSGRYPRILRSGQGKRRKSSGQMVHIPDRAGYILCEQVGGRYSLNLPTGVRPEDVLELELDTHSRTPGKERLTSHIANAELTLDSGRSSSAARLLWPARQLIDWPQSVRACDDRIEVIVKNGLRRISPLQRSDKLSPGALASQAAILAGLLNDLAKEAETSAPRRT
jgi:hypothetical protein